MLIYDNNKLYLVISAQGGFDVETEDGIVVTSFQHEADARKYINGE